MNAGVTSERVYDGLKARLLSGDVLPGERLEPSAFAERLASSVTPVRDALHRLVGEHLVEMRLTEGFQLPFMTELTLRDLLLWNAELARLALRRWPTGQRAGLKLEASDYASGVRELLSAIALVGGSVELGRQIEAASDRLASARAAEARIVPEPTIELGAMMAAVESGEPKTIAQRIAAYHRSRLQLVPAIVQAMYRPG